jgi:hypothetical protein
MPDEFWGLTVREFHIKFRAFVRAENRAESVMLRQALRTSGGDKKQRHEMQQAANRLRQYPVKAWLQ